MPSQYLEGDEYEEDYDDDKDGEGKFVERQNKYLASFKRQRADGDDDVESVGHDDKERSVYDDDDGTDIGYFIDRDEHSAKSEEE
jgi:hypothetical protein